MYIGVCTAIKGYKGVYRVYTGYNSTFLHVQPWDDCGPVRLCHLLHGEERKKKKKKKTTTATTTTTTTTTTTKNKDRILHVRMIAADVRTTTHTHAYKHTSTHTHTHTHTHDDYAVQDTGRHVRYVSNVPQ